MSYMLVLLCLLSLAAALDITLCSSTNLGSDQTSDTFMSNGLCRNYCFDAGYSVAITQNYDCWCSNSVPADSVDDSECDIGCPGYSEEEVCGGDGVYGYVVFGSASTALSSVQSSSSSSVRTASPSSSSLSTSTSTSTTSTGSTSSSSSSIALTSPSSTFLLTSSSAFLSSSTAAPSHSQPTLALATTRVSSSASLFTSSPSTSPITSSFSSSTIAMVTHATTIVSVVTINGAVTQLVLTKYVTAAASTSAASSLVPATTLKNSFFDSTAKVAGTFTAVGVVAAALVAAIVYCCCFAAGTHRDEYTDEEKQYSSDETSVTNTATAAVSGEPRSKTRTSSHSSLRRSSLSKPILTMLNAVSAGTGGIGAASLGRSLSRKKLSPKHDPQDGGVPVMAPILEFDNVLDPRVVFEEYNSSTVSLNDENDYSRRIWHVTNPEHSED